MSRAHARVVNMVARFTQNRRHVHVLDGIKDLVPVAMKGNQPGILETAQMVRDRRGRCADLGCQFVYALFAVSQGVDHLRTGEVGKRLKDPHDLADAVFGNIFFPAGPSIHRYAVGMGLGRFLHN